MPSDTVEIIKDEDTSSFCLRTKTFNYHFTKLAAKNGTPKDSWSSEWYWPNVHTIENDWANMEALSQLLEKRAKYFATSYSAGDSAEKAMKLEFEGLRQRMKGWIAELVAIADS